VDAARLTWRRSGTTTAGSSPVQAQSEESQNGERGFAKMRAGCMGQIVQIQQH
jgi:hypothetical protein